VRAPILALNVDPPDADRCARSNHKMLFRRELIRRYRLIRVESAEALTMPFDAL